jgi:competence protein ComEA
MLSNDEQHPGTGLLRRLPPLHATALAVVTSALIVAVVAAAWLVTHPRTAAEASPVPLGTALDPPQPPEALVFVSGAVAQPGLYRVSTGARVADAIAAAGGITPEADLGRLPNLSARIHDAHQINVPFLKGRGATGVSGRALKLDLNTASVDDLRGVPGMPMGLAEAIVDARGLLGAFRSVSDLHALLDVDSQTLAALRSFLTVSARTP